MLVLVSQAIPLSIPIALPLGIVCGVHGTCVGARRIRDVLLLAIAATLLAFAAMLMLPGCESGVPCRGGEDARPVRSHGVFAAERNKRAVNIRAGEPGQGIRRRRIPAARPEVQPCLPHSICPPCRNVRVEPALSGHLRHPASPGAASRRPRPRALPVLDDSRTCRKQHDPASGRRGLGAQHHVHRDLIGSPQGSSGQDANSASWRARQFVLKPLHQASRSPASRDRDVLPGPIVAGGGAPGRFRWCAARRRARRQPMRPPQW